MIVTDDVLDLILAESEISAGVPINLVAARSRPDILVDPQIQVEQPHNAKWTDEEIQFVADNVGYMSDEEIADTLGRSHIAVKLKRYRGLKMPAASRDHPELMTANSVANALGVDIHSVCNLIELGILPYVSRITKRKIWMIRRRAFYGWVLNPANWPYFINVIKDTGRIQDEHLRRLVERQKERWNDEWWTIGEVAKYHEVNHREVNRFIHLGRIKATKWGNHWVRRSEVMKPELYFVRGSGSGGGRDWSEEADCFILIGSALKVNHDILGRMMSWTIKRVQYRLKVMRYEGIAQDLIGKFGLKLSFDPKTKVLSGSWDDYGYMFPNVDPAKKRWRWYKARGYSY